MIKRTLYTITLALCFSTTANAQGFFKKPPEAAAPAPTPMPAPAAEPAPAPAPAPVRQAAPAPNPAVIPPTVTKPAPAPVPTPVRRAAPAPVVGSPMSAPKPIAKQPAPRPVTVTEQSKPLQQQPAPVAAAQAAPGPDETCGRLNVIARAICVAKECFAKPSHPQCQALAREAEERRAQQEHGGR